MLRLHGFPFSNYHNVVKAILIEKGIPFEEETSYPPADASYLSKNPTGKFPCLELEDGGFLGESRVIMHFLEEAYPEPSLLPTDALQRARVRELMEVIDLYLELPARRLYGEVFASAGKVSDETKAEVRPLLERGLRGLENLAHFSPYIAGPELTLADFSAAFHFPPVSIASKAIYGADLLDGIPAAKRHAKLLGERESVQRARREQLEDETKFVARPSE